MNSAPHNPEQPPFQPPTAPLPPAHAGSLKWMHLTQWSLLLMLVLALLQIWNHHGKGFDSIPQLFGTVIGIGLFNVLPLVLMTRALRSTQASIRERNFVFLTAALRHQRHFLLYLVIIAWLILVLLIIFVYSYRGA